jgi:hypothetical protein
MDSLRPARAELMLAGMRPNKWVYPPVALPSYGTSTFGMISCASRLRASSVFEDARKGWQQTAAATDYCQPWAQRGHPGVGQRPDRRAQRPWAHPRQRRPAVRSRHGRTVTPLALAVGQRYAVGVAYARTCRIEGVRSAHVHAQASMIVRPGDRRRHAIECCYLSSCGPDR